MTDQLIPPGDAAEWFLAIYAADEPSTETVQAWLRWLDASVENRQAFEEIVQIWHSVPSAIIARPSKTAAEAEYDGSISAAEWRSRQHTAQRAERQRYRPLLAVAATAVIATVGLLAYRAFVPAVIARGDFVTHTGEHRQLELADGSQVTLGAHTKLFVDLKPGSRQIRLEAGEAYFSVAKDPTRSFVVRALNGEITAIGTAFNVKAVEDRVTVTVTEGSVKVSPASASRGAGSPPELADAAAAPAVNRLSMGEQLTYKRVEKMPTIAAAQIKHVDTKESARWREGWLVYRDEPLKYVIADISRYTDLPIEVTGPAADLQFSGTVFRQDIDEWIVALPEVASVRVERAGGGYVIRSKGADAIAVR